MTTPSPRRLVCWVAALREAPEITLKSSSFRGWRVRIYRDSEGLPATEYIRDGRIVPLTGIDARLHAALLQCETWDRDTATPAETEETTT